LYGLAFSPDGQTLATSKRTQNGYIGWLYEAKPLTPQEHATYEAVGLVKFLLDRSSVASATDLAERIRADGTISQEVRAEAMILAGPLWEDRFNARSEQEAEKLVSALFGKALLREEVEEELRTRPGLDLRGRASAISMAGSWVDWFGTLMKASWAVVREPGHNAAEYRHALRRAEEAEREPPLENRDEFVLSVARYRAGQYREALSRLSAIESDPFVAATGQGYVGRAFLALCRFKLGRVEEARQSLRALQSDLRARSMTDPRHPCDIPALLLEAEVEIELGPGFPDNPFAP
jgi:hypothetical protein